ncbi:MAG TPA: hypothetical protein VF615_28225 [Longimicrobiaceae bacterium]|jgi:hypothetical protein
MPKSIWDSATKVIFEHGLTFRKVNHLWMCSTAEQPASGVAPADFVSLSDFRPVYIELVHPTRPLMYLLSQDTGRVLDLRISDTIYKREWDRSNYNRHLQIVNAEYCLGLLLHHCKRLAEFYSSALEFWCSQHPDGVDRFEAGGHFEIYYAFDDAVTASMRTLDSFRPMLWYGFGEKGQMPRSFKKLTVSDAGHLPEDIKLAIHAMEDVVDKAKEYRDCIQHYFSPGLRTNFADVQKVGIGFWTLTAWLPDSAETRSPLSFSYDQRTDALRFAWTVLDRIVGLFEVIARHVAPEAA